MESLQQLDEKTFFFSVAHAPGIRSLTPESITRTDEWLATGQAAGCVRFDPIVADQIVWAMNWACTNRSVLLQELVITPGSCVFRVARPSTNAANQWRWWRTQLWGMGDAVRTVALRRLRRVGHWRMRRLSSGRGCLTSWSEVDAKTTLAMFEALRPFAIVYKKPASWAHSNENRNE